jgi:hypothetical protein
MVNSVKEIGDATSYVMIFGTLTHLLPHIAAVLAIIWWGMRIYQTRLEIKEKRRDKTDN